MTSRYRTATKWRAHTINSVCLPDYAVMIMLIYKVVKSSQGRFVCFLGSLQNKLWVFVLRIEMLQIALAMRGLAFQIPTSSN